MWKLGRIRISRKLLAIVSIIPFVIRFTVSFLGNTHTKLILRLENTSRNSEILIKILSIF